MTPQQRQVTVGLWLQQMLAEVLAAFWAGTMIEDPRLWITQRWFKVDRQGRQEIADELARSWDRVMEIEAEATNRRAASGEEAVSVIVSHMGYLRGRTGPTVPPR